MEFTHNLFTSDQSSWASPDKHGPKTKFGSPTWCSTSCRRDSSSSVSWVKDVFWPGEENTFLFSDSLYGMSTLKAAGGWLRRMCIHTGAKCIQPLRPDKFFIPNISRRYKKRPTVCVFWVHGLKHERKHTVECIYTTDKLLLKVEADIKMTFQVSINEQDT